MRKRYAWLLLAGAAFVLSACEMPRFTKPMVWVFNMMPKNAPAKYQQGWRDGCESGLSSMTNDYYRAFYKFKTEPEWVSDQMYYRAWQDTFNFCRHYAYGFIRQASIRSRLPTQPINPRIGNGVVDVLDFNGATNKGGPIFDWGTSVGTFGNPQGGTNIFPDDRLFNYGKEPLFN